MTGHLRMQYLPYGGNRNDEASGCVSKLRRNDPDIHFLLHYVTFSVNTAFYILMLFLEICKQNNIPHSFVPVKSVVFFLYAQALLKLFKYIRNA